MILNNLIFKLIITNYNINIYEKKKKKKTRNIFIFNDWIRIYFEVITKFIPYFEAPSN